MHLTDCIKHAKRVLGGVTRGGHVRPGNFFDFRPSEIAFGAFLGRNRQTANLVIVVETFKRSNNLKAWLRFAPRCGKRFSASYCTYSFSHCSVELRDTNTNCVSSDP